MQRQRQLPRSGGAHFLNVKLWGWGTRLRIIILHESKLHICLVSWGLGESGRSADQTSGSVAQCCVAQCSLIPGNEMILYFSVQLVESLGGGGG